MIEDAKANVNEAGNILKPLKHPNEGNADRIRGVIESSLNNLEKAKEYFIKALKIFLQSAEGRKTVWCAVAFWNMRIILKELGREEESLPWLKQATILREVVDGKCHPYTRQYREELGRLTKKYSLQPICDDALKLSDEETAKIQATLGTGVSL
eukprot:Skav214138  [mRNA]  locus=scaffold1645:59123:59584:- [translate_table: standard]